MHDRDALLGGDRAGELVADLFDEVVVVDALDAHLLELGPPAAQLALDVAVVAREVAEARRVDVDVVQLGEGRGQVVADLAARRDVEGRLGLGPVAQDGALDELHDVEGPLVHELVGAEPERTRHRDAQRVERAEMMVYSRTMSWAVGQHVAHRRAAQRVGVPGRVADAEGQVRASAGDEVEGERRGRAEVLGHPRA